MGKRIYLWTKGFVPRLATYPGWEVPNPLLVEIHRGEADLRRVMTDVLGLTKINFNACVFADGLPVTLQVCRRGRGYPHRGAGRRPNAPAIPALHLRLRHARGCR